MLQKSNHLPSTKGKKTALRDRQFSDQQSIKYSLREDMKTGKGISAIVCVCVVDVRQACMPQGGEIPKQETQKQVQM